MGSSQLNKFANYTTKQHNYIKMIRPSKLLLQSLSKTSKNAFRYDIKNLYTAEEMTKFFNSPSYLHVNRKVYNPQNAIISVIAIVISTITINGLMFEKIQAERSIEESLEMIKSKN